MDAMTALDVPFDGWTVDDLPDTDFRYELVDGALLVTPPAEFSHARLAMALADVLGPALPPGWGRSIDAGVYLGQRNYREPDLVVYLPSATGASRLGPHDLALAVEIVSPGSRANDRVAKPALYAAAGIPHYWRLEQDPLELVVCVLDGTVYRETGAYDGEVVLDEPFAVRFWLDALG